MDYKCAIITFAMGHADTPTIVAIFTFNYQNLAEAVAEVEDVDEAEDAAEVEVVAVLEVEAEDEVAAAGRHHILSICHAKSGNMATARMATSASTSTMPIQGHRSTPPAQFQPPPLLLHLNKFK